MASTNISVAARILAEWLLYEQENITTATRLICLLLTSRLYQDLTISPLLCNAYVFTQGEIIFIFIICSTRTETHDDARSTFLQAHLSTTKVEASWARHMVVPQTLSDHLSKMSKDRLPEVCGVAFKPKTLPSKRTTPQLHHITARPSTLAPSW